MGTFLERRVARLGIAPGESLPAEMDIGFEFVRNEEERAMRRLPLLILLLALAAAEPAGAVAQEATPGASDAALAGLVLCHRASKRRSAWNLFGTSHH